MARIYPGRYTAKMEGSFVVFLIGMRVNRVWALHKWLPVTQAMPRMLRELAQHPELGMLHAEFALTWRGAVVIQYWRSFDQLHAYAHARDAAHLPAWAAFNRSVGNNGSVGIWHETYEVAPGRHETVYGNMPRWGLARAGSHLPATGKRSTARDRLGLTEESSVR
jgi:hypothetical protein